MAPVKAPKIDAMLPPICKPSATPDQLIELDCGGAICAPKVLYPAMN
jgi:hypothetical protein